MKLVYYSSVLNHHQKSLCDEFYKVLGNDFTFITTMKMENQRLALGYNPITAPYVLESFTSEDNRKKAIELAVDCDVLLAGVFPVDVLHKRMQKNKLTFRHIETYFKRGKYRILSPNAIKIAYSEHFKYRKKNLFLLCASAHVASDVAIFNGYPNKKFKWGYFPNTMCSDAKNCDTQESVIKIVWAGRFIKWKKPDYAIKLINDLTKQGVKVHLSMIGAGIMEEKLKAMAQKLNLQKEVSFCGSMPPEKVSEYMSYSDIYLFTSTREEGWGAVLNEAMGNGCAVIASSEAGSTNYLIENYFNGVIYKKNKYKDLLKNALKLCKNKGLREELGENAKKTIKKLWNYEVAAKRFIDVSNKLLNNQRENLYFDEGPMSKG